MHGAVVAIASTVWMSRKSSLPRVLAGVLIPNTEQQHVWFGRLAFDLGPEVPSHHLLAWSRRKVGHPSVVNSMVVMGAQGRGISPCHFGQYFEGRDLVERRRVDKFGVDGLLLGLLVATYCCP